MELFCEDAELFKVTNNSSKVIWETYYYIVKDCVINVDLQKLDSGEKIKIIEVDFEEFLNLVQDESFRNRNFSDMMFRVMSSKKKLKEFKNKLFNIW